MAMSTNKRMDFNDEVQQAYFWADRLSEAGRFEESALKLDEAIESDPKNPVHYLTKGMTLMHAKKYEEALNIFKNGLPLSEGEITRKLKKFYKHGSLSKNEVTKEFHKHIGLSYRRLGNPKKALEHYKIAQGLDPDDVELYSFRANARADIKRLSS